MLNSLNVRFSLLAALVASTLGCSSASTLTDDVGATSERIISGKPSTDAQDAVVLLVRTDMQSYGGCTGTLIAPNLLLTARHCVSQVVEEAFGCDSKGLVVGNSTTAGRAGSDFPVAQFYVFTGKKRPQFENGKVDIAAKGKKIFHDSSKVLCSHDLALILLDKDIPNAQIAQLRLEGDPIAGEKMTAVGWGMTDTSQQPNVRMQRTGIAVDRIGPATGDFDHAPIPPNDFEVGESICSGDSGGPAFSETTNAVIGVVSRGGNGSTSQDPRAQCIGSETRNNYTKIAPFKDLILSAFQAAGHDPWEEGGPDPRLAKFSEACGDDAACRSGLCHAEMCTQACSSDDPCPDGTVCASADGRSVCVTPSDPANPANAAAGGSASGSCSVSVTRSSSGWGAAFFALAGLFGLVRFGRRTR